jgi:hypothetical protein
MNIVLITFRHELANHNRARTRFSKTKKMHMHARRVLDVGARVKVAIIFFARS